MLGKVSSILKSNLIMNAQQIIKQSLLALTILAVLFLFIESQPEVANDAAVAEFEHPIFKWSGILLLVSALVFLCRKVLGRLFLTFKSCLFMLILGISIVTFLCSFGLNGS